MKKVFSFFIACFLFVCLFQVNNVEAAKGDQAGEEKSDYAVAISDLQTTELMGGVTLYKQQIKTLFNGITDTSNKKYAWNPHTVQWVDLPATSENINVVVWTDGGKHSWASSTVRNTAKDFEEKNPGWIVVAAVNGDFFDINGTKEPTNISVQNGEVYQPTVLNNYRKGIGFNSGDFTDVIYGDVSISSKLSIDVLVDGKVTATKQATTVNALSETGICLLTKDARSEFDLTGYKVLVGNYDVCRITKTDQSKVYVRGTIVEEASLGMTKAPSGSFYLASKDGSLDGFLKTDDYVRCQYNLTGDWANYDNVIGSVYQILDNSQPMHQGNTTDDFVYTTHPRTFVGFKEDGSVVMMVTEGRGKESDCQIGTSLFQGGELMRLAGCKTAFNLDGGGSSTLLVRNNKGEFEVINRPSDGGERSIGNAVLFVMRDPGIEFNQKDTTRNTVVFERNETLISNELKNITVTINGEKHEFVGDRLEISGLEESTTYNAVIEYEEPNSKDPTKYSKGKFTLSVRTKDFQLPPSGLKISQINKEGLVVEKEDKGFGSWIQNVSVIVSGESYYLGNESRLEIEGLLSDTEYKVQFKYDVIEPGNPKVYKVEEEVLSIKTLAFNLPLFEKLEVTDYSKETLKVAYEYDDEDDIAESINILLLLNGKEVARKAVTRKRGNVEFTGLDLTKEGYTVKFEVLYYAEEGAMFAEVCYSDEVAVPVVKEEPSDPNPDPNPNPNPEPEPTPQPETPKKGCGKSAGSIVVATLSALSLAVLVIRKRK